MSVAMRRFTVLTLAVLVTITGGANAQQTNPTTLWSFLGIPQAYRRVRDGVSNRRGNRPRLERRPPVKGLADPANLQSDVPAIKKAAEIKQAEDMKKQKIKAVKYLASIGCGCYDKGGEVSGALAASMDDCTEDVRLATVQAIRDAAQGQPCEQCGQSCCCKEVIVMQLARLAYERDDKGCWVEPSERVRQLAAETLQICCPNRGPVEEIGRGATEQPTEPPGRIEQPTEPPGRIEQPMVEPPAGESEAPQVPPQNTEGYGAALTPHRLTHVDPITGSQGHRPSRATTSVLITDGGRAPSIKTDAVPVRLTRSAYGAVVWIDIQDGLAHVHFADETAALPVGAKLRAYRQDASEGLRPVADLQVVKSIAGGANVRLLGKARLSQLNRGDVVTMVGSTQINSNLEAHRIRKVDTNTPQKSQLSFAERIWK